jgi:hypothetical protein
LKETIGDLLVGRLGSRKPAPHGNFVCHNGVLAARERPYSAAWRIKSAWRSTISRVMFSFSSAVLP